MARIRVCTEQSSLFGDDTHTVSLPHISWALYREITEKTAETLNPFLRKLTAKLMLELTRKERGISFVGKSPFELDVFVTEITGRAVFVILALDLYGGTSVENDRLLRLAKERAGLDGRVGVRNGSLTAITLLDREPQQILTLSGRQKSYCLPEEQAERAAKGEAFTIVPARRKVA